MIRGTALLTALLALPLGAHGATPQSAASVDAKELDELQNELARIESASKNFRGTLKHVVQEEYVAKRRRLMKKYQGQIEAQEKSEKLRRGAAITLFENFLAHHPDDPHWSPDAMFRLAELQFEKSNDAYLTATAQAGGAQVTPDYNRTVDLYKLLITEFPHYRLVDGAYYLLGWCLGEMNQEQQALQAMRALVCANKYRPLDTPAPPQPTRAGQKLAVDPYQQCRPVKADSRFLPEAWTRIGEYHFDESELELAIAAYSHVLEFKDSPYYDKALYKLAWSYYRNDNYPDAIKRFDQLVVFSDKKKAKTGGQGSELRSEAIQYLGISFAEKDWNGDSLDDAESGMERIEKFYHGRETEPHVREVYAKLADIYFDETEYFRAIEAYKRTLAKWPYDPENPKLQDRIVMAFDRQRDFAHALKEREALARNYTEGSVWYDRNRNNTEAIGKARELAELALVSAAVNHHKAAQDLKKMAQAQKRPDPKLLERIQSEYRQAAEAYEQYLAQYPNSRNAYEYSYSYAETLYYSGRFAEAAAAYEKVRDSRLDNKYVEDAAFNAVKSYEMALAEAKQKGQYSEPPLPAVGQTAVPVTPLPVPPLVARLQQAYDTFVKRVPSSGRVPTMQYKAAEIPYRYLHWDQARPRLEAIVDRYCKTDLGADAGNAILVSYTIEKDLNQIEGWANRLRSAGCGTTATAQKNAVELRKLSLGVKFQKADQLFAQKKFEEAARLYVQIVDADPKGEDADKALNNAAVAYENVKRYAAATKLYERIVNEYPSSKFVDDALFRTAVSYQKAFEFDRAAVSYLRLADDPRFANSAHRTDALYNAAIIEENDQNYGKAAELFKKYAANPAVKREEASAAFFRAGMNLEKQKNYDQAIKTFAQYVKTYGQDPKGQERVLEAYFRTAQDYEAKKDEKRANAMYKRIVAEGSSVPPASEQAEYAAHAAFVLTEQKLPKVEEAKIEGGGKKLAASIQRFKKNVQDLVADYNRVIGFKRATWTLAAYFRTGYLFETFSKALLAAPCPPEVKRLGADACDIYRDQIEQTVSGVDEEAVKRYGVTLQKAGELGVSNEWTKLARTRANAYKPDVFPMIKDERIDMQLESP